MNATPVELLFKAIDESATILKQELDISYLEALADSGENIFQDEVVEAVHVSELAKKKLNKLYYEINKMAFSREDMRKAFQLACLKGMRENVQPNHQMTPDTIGIFLSYLIGKFMENTSAFTLLDPAIGTGNLVTTVLNHLEHSAIETFGVDVDDLLLKLCYVSANLQEHSLHLFNQDSLEHLLVDPVDVVICDLPVGYYPNDVRANDYELKAETGHSYAHHLFIEQSYRHTKDGGYLFFIIPNGLFESPEAPKLHSFIKDNLDIQALIQLPESMFKNKNASKSIFVLQKKKDGVKPPKEVLLANLPSLSNKQAMQSIISKIDLWIKENK
ncbi:class I SAM-dependent methyltransferase [Caldibacillus lycopersici]|uniref:Class I SAM-dependent methyltransferase n=1 Tax=Perspicuibacillus lycopersici TaxID=1325689 RepID=A0AAE3ITA6_9BACI|nr:class I SAM-dependent methyltransferase [Perspicuibacillus lycopersici]MCU9614210.1 class I SAM-dependent methyltransferase [Perspicuibacillus lycopersici]